MTSQQSPHVLHTNIHLSESQSTPSTMTEEVQKSKRSLQCAFRKAQAKLGLPYTCTAAPVTTVSAVRTHLTRRLPKGRPPHLPFLKLCTTCNEDLLDEHEFEAYRGKDGFKCETPRQQRKGDAGQQEQYDILCFKVETYIITQGNQRSATNSTTAEIDATMLSSMPILHDPDLTPELPVSTQASDTVAEPPSLPLQCKTSSYSRKAKDNVSA